MKQYQTVIFDLDGTLLDTLADLTNSVNHVLQTFGYPTRSIDEVRSFVGNGVKILLKRSFPPIDEELLEKAYVVFSQYYAIHMYDNTKPYNNVITLISSLGNRNLAIVSNKTNNAVEELNKRFFTPYINTAIGTPPEYKKPHPYSIFEVMKHFNSDSSNSIYVGDSDVDIETAHNAGLLCIGVSWGFRGRNYLLSHGADYVVDTANELLHLLNS